VLRLASASGDYTLTFGRTEIDLLPTLQGLAERYSAWLANNVLDTHFNALRGLSRLLVIGGNAEYVTGHLTEWYGEKVIARADWQDKAERMHPADLNAAGGIRMALARQKAKG
jgi:hypothetical protein